MTTLMGDKLRLIERNIITRAMIYGRHKCFADEDEGKNCYSIALLQAGELENPINKNYHN